MDDRLASSAAFFETQNTDAFGEYRGLKYDRVLGLDPRRRLVWLPLFLTRPHG